MWPDHYRKFRALAERKALGETGDGFEAELKALDLEIGEARKKETAEWAQLSRVAFGGLVRLALFVLLFYKVDDTAQTIMLAAVAYVFVETMLGRSRAVESEARRHESSNAQFRVLLRYLHEGREATRDSSADNPLDVLKKFDPEVEMHRRFLSHQVLIRDACTWALWLVATISVLRTAL